MKMGSESIEAIIRSRCILFGGFMAHMEDTRSLKCVVFGVLVGRGLRGEAAKLVGGMSPG